MAKVMHVSTVRQGLEVRAFHLECRAIKDAGFDVEFVVHNGPTDVVCDGIPVRTLGDFRTKRQGLLPRSRVKAFLRAYRILRKSRPDLIHLHDPELIPLGIWLKLTRQCRVVYDSAENYSAYMLQKYYLFALIRWVIFATVVVSERVAGRIFDAIITADQSTMQVFQARAARRVLTLHNFPRLSQFEEPSNGLPNGGGQHDLVYHGSVPKYHLEMAFDITEELKRRGTDIRWLIFGAIDDLAWAKRQIRARGFEGNFTLAGRVDHSEVPALVRTAKIGVIPLPDLPKFHHNIPMKLFEFMALGLPVVMSDLPPSRPFVDGRNCALFATPGDPVEFANAIRQFLCDSDLRTRAGADGREQIEQRFNWETESKKLVSLYRELDIHPSDLQHRSLQAIEG